MSDAPVMIDVVNQNGHHFDSAIPNAYVCAPVCWSPCFLPSFLPSFLLSSLPSMQQTAFHTEPFVCGERCMNGLNALTDCNVHMSFFLSSFVCILHRCTGMSSINI